MAERDPYFLGYRSEEQQRLERQAFELASDSQAFFDRLGVAKGWRVVEIGCGPQGCLELLSKRVGPDGRVTGVERSPEQAETAQRFAQASHLANVEVQCLDARDTGLPADSFDFATERLVLVNVPSPQEIVNEMARLVRPGGWVAFHEPDSSTQRSYPSHPAQQRLFDIIETYRAQNGIDSAIGPRVPAMARAAGLVDVEVTPLVHVYPRDHGRRFLPVEFALNARERVLEKNIASAAELDALCAALRTHLENPDVLVVSSLFFQVSARKSE